MPDILHFAHPASDRALPEACFALRGDPLAAIRRIHAFDAARGYAAGTATSIEADVLIEAYPWVELVIVEAGRLEISGADGDLSVGPGESLVIPRGARLRWRHAGELKRLFMAFPGRASEGAMPAAPVKIDHDVSLAPCSPPAAGVLLSPVPEARSRTLFESGGVLRIGVWACTPYLRRLVEPGYCEWMQIHAGSIALTTPEGAVHQVRAGESVLVPAGATNAWASDEPVRKLFCILS